MSLSKSSLRWFLVILLVTGGGGAYFYFSGSKPDKTKTAAASKKPIVVEITTVQTQDVPLELKASGQVQALQTLDVKPPVGGMVAQILFKEGSFVKAGQRLFQLDDASERAALDKAKAQLTRDQALLADAERVLRDQQKLFEQNFIAAAALESSRHNVDALRAALVGDKAAIHAAEVDVQYKVVNAAIAGRAGVITVVPGSVVSPTMATPMVTLTQTNPIAVTFTVPERELPLVLAAQRAGAVTVTAVLPDQSQQPHVGRLSFIDSGVDAKSGTLRLKAEFPNEPATLWPGLFVTLNLQLGVEKNALVLPVAGVQTGPDGQFVYTVGPDKKVKVLPVKVLAIRQEQAVVSGLAAGTAVITNGALNVHPGSEVQIKGKPVQGEGHKKGHKS